jgi:WD40 repeat protein
MLVDGKGKRIDKGPIEIVADPRRPDQKVETGISCMSCHARGLIFKADQLRGHVEKNAAVFGQAIVDTLRATHPRKGRFQAQIEEDNVRYLKALESFGVRDPDQEPVNLVTSRFEGTLDGPTAAAEFGLILDEFGSFLKRNPEHARILGALLVKGGTAQRGVFQDNFPELSRRLLAYQATLAAKAKPRRDPPFEGHTAVVNAVAFSADSTKAASGSDDRKIRVWSIPDGKLLATLEGDTEVFAVAFSPDGKFLASAGRDRWLRLWNLETRQAISVFKGHTGIARTVAFSPDGKWLASGGDDRSVRVWNIAKIEETAALTGHTEAITSLAWYRDGQQIVTGSRDGTVRWWDVSREKQLARLDGHAGPVLCVALAEDGRTVVSGGNDKAVRLWNLPDAKELHSFAGHLNAVIDVRFHTNGREVLSSSSQHQTSPERNFRRWDMNDRKEVGSMQADDLSRFSCAASSPDGRHVLVGGPGGFLRLWSW